ncbi:MAG: peptide chain release factor N(5)-glutamine methyltransferase [Bacteroidales bacterium]|nr:peptide chain release factor N(5)-glutamine methyltransferase [Bacteroidales bacterium]
MKIPSNKVKDIKLYMYAVLEHLYSSEEISVFAEILLEKYADISRANLYLYPNKTVSESVLLKINNGIKSLKKQKPIQYIIGETVFMNLTIKVNPSVLIPRHETEELVMAVIKYLDSCPVGYCPSIIDAGTGSGAIALSIKKQIPKSEVFAFDNSEDALNTARLNALENGLAVDFFADDILNFNSLRKLTKFDVLISNPPYVRLSEKELMKENVVGYEPFSALFVSDDNPLIYYESLSIIGKQLLKQKGMFFCEINEAFGRETEAVLVRNGYKNVEIIKDISGKDRFVKGQMIN